MLSLMIKDIRKVLEETLAKFYDFADYSIGSTKVNDSSKEFRIEFRIYDSEFWMDIDPSIDSIHIGTRSFGEPGHRDTIQMWLSKPFDYDKDKFQFGWRTDLETFFDAFHEALLEKLKKTQKTTADEEGGAGAAVIAAILGGLDTNKSATKDNKTSIFNNLKDGEDEYI